MMPLNEKDSAPLEQAPISIKILPSRRVFELDVLRGVAILLVLLFHGLKEPKWAGCFGFLIVGLDNFGWSGVDLFFVLSGFLIGNILFQEIKQTGSLNIWQFYIRRGFRIWPAYYAFILGSLIFATTFTHSAQTEWRNLPVCLVFLQNLNSRYKTLNTAHTWSLCIEEHFYLIVPLLLLFLLRTFSFHRLPKIIYAVCLFCLASRSLQIFYGMNLASHFSESDFLFNTFNRIDALLGGVILAYFYIFDHGAWLQWGQQRNLLIIVGLASLMPMLFLNPYIDHKAFAFVGSIGLTMTYFGYCCIMVAILNLSGRQKELLSSNLIARLVAWFGYYSYTIYLWHFFLLAGIAVLFRLDWGNLPSCFVPLGCALAAISPCFISALFIERPALKIRDRLFPSKRAMLKAQ